MRNRVQVTLATVFLFVGGAQQVFAVDQVMGNWDGTWKNDDGHGDKLTAQIVAEGDDNYRAIFTAYYGQISIFKVALKGKRQREEVKFGGKVDLGVLFGGVFEWTGAVAEDKFTGRYKGDKDVGEFILKKSRKTPPSLAEKLPPGAVVLFDGKDLGAWRTADDKPAPWKLVDGAMEVSKGHIYTRNQYGDIQLHIEFMTPLMPTARGQARGNSGVFIDRTLESTARDWEVQILDSFGLESKDNECGAVYGLKAPSMNACLPPGEWQTYDITFTAPRRDNTGNQTEKARINLVHNGVKTIDDLVLDDNGPTTGHIMLQDHGDPVRYRNIWLVPSKGTSN